MNTGSTKSSAIARARRRLLLLLVLFALPVLVAYVLYYTGWRPEARGNYGILVQPARPLPAELRLTVLDGSSEDLNSLHGRWSLVALVDGSCSAPCTRHLDTMQRLILSQGKEAHRLRAVLVVVDAHPSDALRESLRGYPGVLVFSGTLPAVGRLASHFSPMSDRLPGNLGEIYLVDPLGNFMLYWPADADIRRMRKDISRLLRVSQVG